MNPQPGERASDSSAGEHAEIHAQLVRLGAGQHLIQTQDAIEVLGRDPSFAIHERVAQHRDLHDRATPREESESQKPQKQTPQRFVWNARVR